MRNGSFDTTPVVKGYNPSHDSCKRVTSGHAGTWTLDSLLLASSVSGLGNKLDRLLRVPSASRPFAWYSVARTSPTRYFHKITMDFVTHDRAGKLVFKKIFVIAGNPGEAYTLISPTIGQALCSVDPETYVSAWSQDRCKLIFFHDT